MNVLLLNNGSKRLKQIQEMLNSYSITTQNYWDLKDKNINQNDFDFIVLSGGSFTRASNITEALKAEIKLIKNSEIPIFGICMGMQLIVRTFNETYLTELRPKRRGVIKINYKGSELNVFENHKWTVENVTNPLEKILSSDDGVEFIKHKTKPIWGVQFHPEADKEFGTNGKTIFDEFITKNSLNLL